MNRLLAVSLMVVLTSTVAKAHFVFVVPDAAEKEARVFLSENLKPNTEVKAGMISGTKLQIRDEQGNAQPLEMREDKHVFRVALAGEGNRVVFGQFVLGVYGHGDKPGNLVTYYPKSIVGDPFASSATVSADHPVEIVPVGSAGNLKFMLLSHGKIQPNTQITVILPDGDQKEIKTDVVGMTPAFKQAGRYGVWGRVTLGDGGEHDGKPYASSRGYATLTIQVEGAASSAPTTQPAAHNVKTPEFALMPHAAASFGAVASDGWLYVYGGHIVKAHDYDTEAVTGDFFRLNLSEGSSWQALPEGPALQGMNLAVHKGLIYRVGGMQPRNPVGEKADNYSVADCARYNPATKQWEWLPPMPHGRSSHDMAVVGDTLYVLGGWTMNGRQDGNEWCEKALALDLSAVKPSWKQIDQPFVRRALIVAVHNQKIFVIGGMDDGDEISREVNVFDPARNAWTMGPELPDNSRFIGFSPAACTLDGRLYTSLADGSLYRLSTDESEWELVGSTSPRFVHRMVPWQSHVVIVGGASRSGMQDLVEAVIPSARPIATPAETTAGTGNDKSLQQKNHPTTQPSKASQQKPVNQRAEKRSEPAKVATQSVESQAAAIGSAAEEAGQVYCPIMTTVEVAGDDDVIVVDYEGTEVLICCSKCANKWKKDPVAYLDPKILPQLKGMALPERTIRQVYCPVYPKRVVSEKDPFVMYKGQKIYLFNNAAVRRWKANPEKYVNPEILPQLASAAN